MTRREVNEVEQLAAAWRVATTQRERASLEARIWDAAATPGPRNRYLSKLLGESSFALGDRHLLHNAGAVAAPLWEAIDGEGLVLHSAVTVYRSAKGDDYRPPTTGAVRDALDRYLTRSVRVVRGDGKVFRKRVQSKGRRAKTRRDVWLDVRAILGAWVDRELREVEPLDRERLMREFAADMSVLIGGWGAKIKRASSRGSIGLGTMAGMVSRRKVVAACRTLSMDPPPIGAAADLARARKQQRALARIYHPDATGSHDKVELFNEAMAAYRTLEEYNETRTMNGVVNGASECVEGNRV